MWFFVNNALEATQPTQQETKVPAATVPTIWVMDSVLTPEAAAAAAGLAGILGGCSVEGGSGGRQCEKKRKGEKILRKRREPQRDQKTITFFFLKVHSINRGRNAEVSTQEDAQEAASMSLP